MFCKLGPSASYVLLHERVIGYSIPGVMQFESNRFSVGKISPLEIACLSRSSASRADLSHEQLHLSTPKTGCNTLITLRFHLCQMMFHIHYRLGQVLSQQTQLLEQVLSQTSRPPSRVDHEDHHDIHHNEHEVHTGSALFTF